MVILTPNSSTMRTVVMRYIFATLGLVHISDVCTAYEAAFNLLNSDLNVAINPLNDLPAGKPCVIEFIIHGLTTISPKQEFNKPISKLAPQLEEKEYNDAMDVNRMLMI